MFGFFFSWFIGNEGKQSAVLKSKHCLTWDFLSALLFISSSLSFDAAAAGRGRGGRLDADAEEKEGELQKVSTEAAQAAGGRRRT